MPKIIDFSNIDDVLKHIKNKYPSIQKKDYFKECYFDKETALLCLGNYYNDNWKIPKLQNNIDLRLDGIINNKYDSVSDDLHNYL